MSTYNGNEPYIFISYAHADSATVLPLIEGLQSRGFRVWFDAGINAGDEWSETLADRITECHYMLLMLSEAAVNSDYCRKEITFALTVDRMYKNKLQPGDLDNFTEEQIEEMKAICKKRQAEIDYLYQMVGDMTI